MFVAQKTSVTALMLENNSQWGARWFFENQFACNVLTGIILLNYISNAYAQRMFRYVSVFAVLCRNHLVYINTKQLLLKLKVRHHYRPRRVVELSVNRRGQYFIVPKFRPSSCLRVLFGLRKIRKRFAWRFIHHAFRISMARGRRKSLYRKLFDTASGLYVRKLRNFIFKFHPHTRVFGDKYLYKVC